MTVLEFTNQVDGLITDFENGATDGREFRSGIMDLLIEVAKPKLDDAATATIEAQLLTQHFRKPGINDDPLFYTTSMLLGQLQEKTPTLLFKTKLSRALDDMGIEKIQRRIAYAQTPTYGYYLCNL